MKIRVWCTKHEVHAVNVGNGRILYPTTTSPSDDEDGWMELDASEFACEAVFADSKTEGPCNLVFQLEAP